MDERADDESPFDPFRHHLGGNVGVPGGAELRHRFALAAAAVADDHAREPDRRVLAAPRLDHLLERGLAHRIGTKPGKRARDRNRHRREVGGDPFRLGQVRERRLRDQRRTGHVRVERPPPHVDVVVGQFHQLSDPRRVHEAVEAAHPVGRFGDRCLHRLGVRDVAHDRHRVRARLLGGALEAVTASGEQGHAVPPLAQPGGDATTETARCADDRDSHGSPFVRFTARGPDHARPPPLFFSAATFARL